MVTYLTNKADSQAGTGESLKSKLAYNEEFPSSSGIGSIRKVENRGERWA